ncbi:MAG TPA: hypothetical protein VHL34_06880 [Rhizomicrobium sp.]|nr:hypothetical protein [Rhizomicrobium sp.]
MTDAGSAPGLDAVWSLLGSVVVRQPVPMQILIGLGVAFAALMVIEGIRASFFRRAAAVAAPEPAAPVMDDVVSAPVPANDASLLEPELPVIPEKAARVVPPRAVPRKRISMASYHKATRPVINRAALAKARASLAYQPSYGEPLAQEQAAE